MHTVYKGFSYTGSRPLHSGIVFSTGSFTLSVVIGGDYVIMGWSIHVHLVDGQHQSMSVGVYMGITIHIILSCRQNVMADIGN
jgi:hypothetical protein